MNSDTLLPSAGCVSNILFVVGMSMLAMIFYFSVLITFSVCGEYFYTCKFVIIGKNIGIGQICVGMGREVGMYPVQPICTKIIICSVGREILEVTRTLGSNGHIVASLQVNGCGCLSSCLSLYILN